jgi:hypothetical protein
LSPSQNDMGRAFEYGIAVSLSDYLPAPIQDSLQVRKARRCFELCSETDQRNIVLASTEATAFITAHDNRLVEDSCFITMQSDQRGQYGDVRDIIVHNTVINADIGISAKHRHSAVKHSRLSERINFGYDWFGIHCSDGYFHQITPIFRELRSKQRRNEKWRDIPDKRQRYYMPVLQAFQQEIQSLFQSNPNVVARGLVQYLLGRYDYYKVIKENGAVSIMSFNLEGSLKWGSRIPLPTRMIEISQKPNSETTIFITFDHGWQISFRIHNASTMVEPSLKFDINLIGLPSTMSRHVVEYG